MVIEIPHEIDDDDNIAAAAIVGMAVAVVPSSIFTAAFSYIFLSCRMLTMGKTFN